MAQVSIPDDKHAPTYSRRYLAFGSAISLHTQGASAAVSPPAGIAHLPCQVIVEHDVGDVFAYTDSEGTTKEMAFLTAGTTAYRMAPSTIETTTTCVAVTVFWCK